jgi:hypothetical protein
VQSSAASKAAHEEQSPESFSRSLNVDENTACYHRFGLIVIMEAIIQLLEIMVVTR